MNWLRVRRWRRYYGSRYLFAQFISENVNVMPHRLVTLCKFFLSLKIFRFYSLSKGYGTRIMKCIGLANRSSRNLCQKRPPTLLRSFGRQPAAQVGARNGNRTRILGLEGRCTSHCTIRACENILLRGVENASLLMSSTLGG